MTQVQRVLLLVAGGALVLVGLLLGLVPSSVTVAGDPVTCGSPWVPDGDSAGIAEFRDRVRDARSGLRPQASTAHARCDETLGSRGVYGGVVVVLGLAAAGAGLFVQRGVAPGQPAAA